MGLINLINNPITIVVLVIIFFALCVYIYNNSKGILYKASLYAVAKAEEAWGSEMGKVKFAEVYTYLQKQYPIITFFVSEKQLASIIESALANLETILYNKQLPKLKDDE